MLYKPDFESIIPRMEAWWKGEMLDRACIAAYAPNGKPRREVPKPPTLYEQWTNHDYILDRTEAGLEATYFAGEATPMYYPNLGPDLFAALLGGNIEYRETTSWVAPFLDWDNPVSFEINKASFEWKWLMEMYERVKERSRGRYLVGGHDCHSGGDALLAMRGGTNLCMDLYDRPDDIKAAMRKLEAAVEDFHKSFWGPIEANGQKGHTTSWLRVWSPGRSNAIQLDLLALISPEMFEEFFFHELEVQCNILDNTIFHLDGPDAIRHLEKVCELPMRGIQWVHGDGKGPMTKWIPLLKRIQALGKNLHITCRPEEVETILGEISSKGVFIQTWASSKEEADAVIKTAAKLARD